MTEAEWFAWDDPQMMLGFLRGKTSDRKVRLFAVACCRWAWQFLTEEPSREAVRVAELFADGLASDRELTKAEAAAAASELAVWDELEQGNFDRVVYDNQDAAVAAQQVAFVNLFEHDPSVRNSHVAAVVYATHSAFTRATMDEEPARRCQFSLLHDIIGNPFRSVVLDPSWLTSTVEQLAGAVYEERAFDRLPILADALEDAGCTNADMLNHCRQPGEHVRGCWVVDLLLGKT